MNDQTPLQDSAQPHNYYPLYELKSPRDLLSFYVSEPVHPNSYLALLMNCVRSHDISDVVRCIPANLFEEFKLMISEIAALPSREDFVVIGQPVTWGIEEARMVDSWLAKHPDPELAPPDSRISEWLAERRAHRVQGIGSS